MHWAGQIALVPVCIVAGDVKLPGFVKALLLSSHFWREGGKISLDASLFRKAVDSRGNEISLWVKNDLLQYISGEFGMSVFF